MKINGFKSLCYLSEKRWFSLIWLSLRLFLYLTAPPRPAPPHLHKLNFIKLENILANINEIVGFAASFKKLILNNPTLDLSLVDLIEKTAGEGLI